ncbi:MAG: aldehyde dehydrogenase [Coxiellaceae bacterium]|nr:aldehyde dehydrogenase [Coxiellaceae bacterium]
MEISKQQVQSTIDQMDFKTGAFIDGQYTQSKSNETFECVSPINGKKVVDIAACSQADVDMAVACAKRAYEKGVWAKQSPLARKTVLLKFADLIEKHAMELAVMETMDMGKPIADSISSDVPGAAYRLRWTAEAVDKVYGNIAPTAPDTFATITREPCGVVGIITPWNFPLYLAALKFAPALAAGNSVVIKPAEQSPLTTIRIAELAAEAGIPEGVFNVLPGMGETAGQALCLHNDVDMISFTGSSEVGKLIMQYSGQSNLKRVHLECGGKSPNIIFADAPDLTEAARASARSVFLNSGQICCAPTRLLVENKVREQVMNEMLSFAKDFQPGDPLDPATQLGSMVDKVQMDRVLSYIESGRQSAKLACGGEQVMQDTGGFYISPTIFDMVTNDMKIAQEEIFGPVLSVIGFDSTEEAIQIANDTTYGLAGSVWTGNINKAHQMSSAIRAGLVSVNCLEIGDATVTFGGYKQSGIGTEGAFFDFDNYSEIKTTWMRLS